MSNSAACLAPAHTVLPGKRRPTTARGPHSPGPADSALRRARAAEEAMALAVASSPSCGKERRPLQTGCSYSRLPHITSPESHLCQEAGLCDDRDPGRESRVGRLRSSSGGEGRASTVLRTSCQHSTRLCPASPGQTWGQGPPSQCSAVEPHWALRGCCPGSPARGTVGRLRAGREGDSHPEEGQPPPDRPALPLNGRMSLRFN